MELRPLGRTDLRITPVGLGCWQFSKGGSLTARFWPVLEQETVDRIVAASLEGGVNWFDTAEAYGKGLSEEALASALQAAGRSDGDVVVATKWYPILRTTGSIRRTVDERLEHLSPFSIDLHQIHARGALATLRGQMEAMADLVDSGTIRAVGVSNFSARAMRRCQEVLEARGIPLAANQVRYSLLHRRIESNGILDTARELGITIIAYSPLAQGLLTGKFHDDPGRLEEAGPRRRLKAFRPSGLEKSAPLVAELKEIAGAHDATPAQVALRWLLQAHEETVVVIPGATRVDQAEDNAGTLALELAPEEVERLDAASRGYL